MVSSPFLTQILHNYTEAVGVGGKYRIRNAEEVEEKLGRLINGGSQALQVISDFDATLSRYHLNGKPCDSSYGIIANSPLVSEKMKAAAWDLFREYHPIEVDPTMSKEEKTPFMLEWYEKSHEVMIHAEPKMTKSAIQQMVTESNCFLRDAVPEFVEKLQTHQIPLLILSGGIGDLVDGLMRRWCNSFEGENSGKKKSNGVKIIANFMEFEDGTGNLVGFKDPLVHIYNKNETALHGDHSEYFQELRHRHNVVLLGDSLGDVDMDEGIDKPKTVLRIGFLNKGVKDPVTVNAYENAYDIVLLDDQSFTFMNLILDNIVRNDTI